MMFCNKSYLFQIMGSSQEITEKEIEKEIEPTKWTVNQTDVFIDLMVEQVKLGNRPTFTFPKKA